MNYTDFSEDERKFYLSESGFDSREKEFFRLRVYEEKTLFETAEIMGYSPRTIDRINRKVKKKIVKVAPDVLSGLFFVSWRKYGEIVSFKYLGFSHIM